MIAMGIGCRRGATAADIVALIDETIGLLGGSSGHVGAEKAAIAGLFSHVDKRTERGLAEAATTLDLPLTFLDSAVLALVADRTTSCSRRVEDRFGLPGIAETAALAGAGAGAVLLVPKVSSPTVTCAIAGPPFA